jgi:hypothetical protein
MRSVDIGPSATSAVSSAVTAAWLGLSMGDAARGEYLGLGETRSYRRRLPPKPAQCPRTIPAFTDRMPLMKMALKATGRDLEIMVSKREEGQKPWMAADDYGRSLKGFTLNLLVRNVPRSVDFCRGVGAQAVYADADFAVAARSRRAVNGYFTDRQQSSY